MQQEWNGYRMGREQIQNGSLQERVQNGNRTHSVRRSLFLLIGSVSYLLASRHCLFQEVNSISKHLAEILSYGHFHRACFELQLLFIILYLERKPHHQPKPVIIQGLYPGQNGIWKFWFVQGGKLVRAPREKPIKGKNLMHAQGPYYRY